MDHKKRSKINGYVLLKEGEHTKSFNREGSGENTHVYEHHVVAESMLGRELRKTEEVHHLDKNRSNNSPDNLLVLEKGQHVKLHSWLDKNIVVAKPNYAIRKAKGCIRCAFCEIPIPPELKKFCSNACMYEYNQVTMRKETPVEHLIDLISRLPLTKVGELVGLSDNGVRKRCKALGIILP